MFEYETSINVDFTRRRTSAELNLSMFFEIIIKYDSKSVKIQKPIPYAADKIAGSHETVIVQNSALLSRVEPMHHGPTFDVIETRQPP